MERAFARYAVERAPTAEELEPEVERTLTGEWPAVRMEEMAALEQPTRPLVLPPEILAALDELGRRS